MAKLILLLMAVVISLGLSYIFNRLMWKRLGERVIYTLSPVLEETLKTLPAFYIGLPFLWIHFLFGVGEGVYDWNHSNPRYGRWAALLSVISHILFGGLTYGVLHFGGPLPAALMTAIVFHGLWNYFIIASTHKRNEKEMKS